MSLHSSRLRAAVLLLLLWAAPAIAIEPMAALPGYKRTSWTIEDGAPAAISALTQAPDGFLWIGTTVGLFRFDGISFERLQRYERRNGAGVDALLTTRSGDIWIGYGAGGVGLVRNGKLMPLPDGGPTSFSINLAEGRDGDMWVSTRRELFRFRNNRWDSVTYPDDDTNGRRMTAARDGTVWITSESALYRVSARSMNLDRAPVSLGITSAVAADVRGRIWVADGDALRPVLRPGAAQFALGPPAVRVPRTVKARWIFFDQTGSLWALGNSRALLRHPNPSASGDLGRGRPQLFQAALSDPAYSSTALEDREGNVWIGTELGLDRFRPVDIVQETIARGLDRFETPAGGASNQVTVDGRGTIYVRQSQLLFRMNADGSATRLPFGAGPTGWDRICPAKAGIWARENNDRLRLVDGPVARVVRLPPGARGPKTYTSTCVEDSAEQLWVGINPLGFHRYDGRMWTKFDVDDKKPTATPFLVGRDQQGLPLAYHGYGHVTRMEGSTSRILWRREAIPVGFVATIYPGAKHLLFGGETGFSRFDGRTFRTISTERYPWLQDVSGIVETKHGETWMISKSGLLKFATAELERRLNGLSTRLTPEILDHEDGIFGIAQVDGWPNAVQAGDGRLWFATNNGVFSIDPKARRENKNPPPVVIRSLLANGRGHPVNQGLKLPPGTRTLQVDYAALSLSVPKRVRYRYRLIGSDQGWVDPGLRRQAIYTNLLPGDYRFQVIAANNDGIWNREGAVLAFSIEPSFTQTRLFLALCAAGVFLLLSFLYSIRLKQVAARVREQTAERVSERERIARELHDTLLQGMQGLILQVQVASEQVPSDLPGGARLRRAIDQAEALLIEGRERVAGLRSSAEPLTLSDAVVEAAKRILGTDVRWRVTQEGPERPLQQLATEELTRIVEEALQNVRRHAQAHSVDIDIAFGASELMIRVGDDGVGMDQETATRRACAGHFGLTGMRERADALRAKFELTSRPGGGTKIRVSVPARIAYERQLLSRGWWRRLQLQRVPEI